MSQTQRVRMNLRPGSLSRSSVLHSQSSGFSDSWPAIGLRTTASLKRSITAAMANAPPSRSYRLDSVISYLLDGSDGFLEPRTKNDHCSSCGRDAVGAMILFGTGDRAQGIPGRCNDLYV